MNVHETELRVRYCETDRMGCVHHSRYYPWFEIARTEMMAESGLRYSDMEKGGVMMPLVETHCKYIVPAVYDDVLIIRTLVEKLSPVKVTFAYEVVRKADGVLLARGSTVLAFTMLDFKPVNLKKYNPEFWELVSSLQ